MLGLFSVKRLHRFTENFRDKENMVCVYGPVSVACAYLCASVHVRFCYSDEQTDVNF